MAGLENTALADITSLLGAELSSSAVSEHSAAYRHKVARSNSNPEITEKTLGRSSKESPNRLAVCRLEGHTHPPFPLSCTVYKWCSVALLYHVPSHTPPPPPS